MKLIQFRKNKGIAATDTLIAIIIITLFSSIIGSIAYNVYLSNISVKRMSKRTCIYSRYV